jgi:hypothetical protein
MAPRSPADRGLLRRGPVVPPHLRLRRRPVPHVQRVQLSGLQPRQEAAQDPLHIHGALGPLREAGRSARQLLQLLILPRGRPHGAGALDLRGPRDRPWNWQDPYSLSLADYVTKCTTCEIRLHDKFEWDKPYDLKAMCAGAPTWYSPPDGPPPTKPEGAAAEWGWILASVIAVGFLLWFLL